jgi:hypothetical protein
MPGFLALLIINIVVAALTTAAAVLLAPKPKSPKAQGFQAPIAQAGVPVPVVYGVAQVAPNTVAFGNLAKLKYKQWIYFGSFQQVLCWGIVNEIIDIIVGDKSCRNWHTDSGGTQGAGPLAAAVENDGGPVEFVVAGNWGGRTGKTKEPMFGGAEQGGGFGADTRSQSVAISAKWGKHGDMCVYWGFDSIEAQPHDSVLREFLYGPSGAIPESVDAADYPRWPGLCYLRMGHEDGTPFYVASSSGQMPAINVLVRRTAWWAGAYDTPTPALSPLGQTPEEATIRYDANPAEVLYDLETNALYGIGRSASRIDLESFEAAAVTLREEQITATKSGFGISCIVNQPNEAGQTIRGILDCIDAVLSTNPLTGKLRLKLLRNDYDVETLPEINSTNSRDVRYVPSSWNQTFNEVSLTYQRFSDTTSKRGFVPDTITDHDLANIQSTGKVRWSKVEIPYITDPDIAAFALSRLRRSRSIPLKRFSWTMTRDGYGLMQGDVVKASAELFDQEDLILRITSIDYGSLEEGEIKVEAVQDIFSVADESAYVPAESSWSDPADTDASSDDSTAEPPEDADGVTWGVGF